MYHQECTSTLFSPRACISLQSTQLSVIINETTDISTCKKLAVVTRLYDKETMSIKCCLYDLLEVSQGDAETLFQLFLNVLERDEIPSNNIIGFAADTTIVMFGEHNSVVSRLKEKNSEYLYHALYLSHCSSMCITCL